MSLSLSHPRTSSPATLVMLTLGMLFALSHGALAQGRTAPPVDEASKDASFVAFRQKLIDAIARRDVDYVVSQASTDVQLGFSGEAGRKEFKSFLTLSEADLADEYKKLAASEREGYWDALEDVLRMGGRFTNEGAFEAPYTVSVPLGPKDDTFTTWFVVGTNIPLLDRPNRYGKVVATLDYHIVTTMDGGEGTSFSKVKVMDEMVGYVDKAYLRSPAGYRARFEKREGRWQLVMFLAGD